MNIQSVRILLFQVSVKDLFLRRDSGEIKLHSNLIQLFLCNLQINFTFLESKLFPLTLAFPTSGLCLFSRKEFVLGQMYSGLNGPLRLMRFKKLSCVQLDSV